jgi:hypothetical protein
MIALLMSPLADSTTMSITSLEGAIVEREDDEATWVSRRVLTALRSSVGAIGLNLHIVK